MNGIKQYLFENGLLGKSASKEEIEKAKSMYLKQYNFAYQKEYARKTKRVNIALSKDQYSALLVSAKRHNQKLATHLKSIAFAYLRDEYIVPNKQEVQSLQLELKAIGRNINQLAKKVNSFGSSQFNQIELLQQIDLLENSITKALERPQKSSIRKQLSDVFANHQL